MEAVQNGHRMESMRSEIEAGALQRAVGELKTVR